jgi:hypothetical protein
MQKFSLIMFELKKCLSFWLFADYYLSLHSSISCPKTDYLYTIVVHQVQVKISVAFLNFCSKNFAFGLADFSQ